jgi:hypothetical protein
MKHKWKITPRGKKSKYYDCLRCGLHTYGWSLKEVNKEYPKCEKAKE